MKKILFLIPVLIMAMTADAKNCTISVTINGDTTACGSVILTAVVTDPYSGITYDWSGGRSTATAKDTFSSSNTYTVTVTDDSMCTATASRVVTVNPFPSPGILATISGCSPVILTATGGSTYAWSGGSSPDSATNGITSTGNYTVTVTSSEGCSSATSSGTETVRQSPSALITPGSATQFCSGGSVLLTAPSSGDAINFAGRGYVSATGYNVDTSNFTVEAWIYPLTTARGVIVSQGGVSCGTASYAFEYYNDTLELQTSTSSGCQGIIIAPNSVVTGQWQHVAASVTRGGNLAVLYVNDVAVASGNIANGNIGSTSLTIGGSSTSGYDFNGVIDEVRIWNIALSQTAIQSALYSIVPANSYGLVTYYRFDEGTGTTPTDLAGGNDGTFNGSLVWQTPSSAPVFENGGTSLLYNWSSGSAVQSTQATVSGSYVVLVTNTSNGCTATDTVPVTVDTIPTVTVDSVGSLCPGSSFSLSASGGGTYAWSGPDGFTSTQQDNTLSDITTLAGGEYSVTVTTNQGCTASKFENVGVFSAPFLSVQSNSPQCLGSTLTVSASGGVTYVWSGPNSFSSHSQDTSIISTVTASGGTYNVTATDINGCTASVSFNDTVNSLPTPTTSSSTVCTGTTLIVSATGGVSYTWTGPNNNAAFASSDTVLNATAEDTGTYYVTVTDSNGCSAMDSVQASIYALPAATAGSNSPLCIGTTLNLTSGGGTSYSWSGPAGFASSSQDTSITGSVTAGTYTVTVTGNNGCSASASVSVTVNSPPASPTANSSGAVCAGSSLTLSASGANSYSWSGPNGFTSFSQSPVIGITTSADSGLYTVTVTTNGCSATASTNAIVYTGPNAAATNSTVGSQCAGANIYLFASGGTSYQWSGPLGYESNNQNDTILAATAAATGIYTVTVTSGNSCSATASTSLTVVSVPAAAIAGLSGPICAGEPMDLSANGGNTYSWSGPGGFTSGQQDVFFNQITTAQAGTYTVTVTNTGNCSATASTTVVVDSLPVFQAFPTNLTFNATNGLCSAVVYFAASASGYPAATVSYSQNPGTSFPVGTTTVLVSAANTCGTITGSFMVTVIDNQPPALTCPANIDTVATQATGTKVLTIPTPPVSDNCGVASVVNNFTGTSNASGTYPTGITTILWTVTDVNGNTTTCSQTINVHPRISLSGSVVNSLCPGTFLGSISTTISGGRTPYTYLWSNGSTAANLSNIAAGTYTITVKDADMSTISETFTVETIIPSFAPACPGPINGLASVCAGATVTYSIAAVPNTVLYNWSFSNAVIESGQGTTQVTVFFPSGYKSGYLQVAAVNCIGTSTTAQLQINVVSTPPIACSIVGPSSVCANTTVSYSVAPNSNNNATSFTWTVPSTATIASGQGTSSVSIHFGTTFISGSVGVYGSNCSGNGPNSTISIILVKNSASTPSSISPSGGVCPGDTVTYSCGLSSNAGSYTWAVPAHAAIVSGQGTTSLTVAFQTGYTGGSVTVYASNCDGNSSTVTLSVPLNTQVPGIPGLISCLNNNQNMACPNDTLTFTCLPANGARSYFWTLPANTTLVSGQGTTMVTFAVGAAFSGGNISVYATNCAGSGQSSSQFISISNPPGSPGYVLGDYMVCSNFIYTYTTSPASGDIESYIWTVPSNATIITGQGTLAISVSYSSGFSSGTISVSGFNCLGNGQSQSLNVYAATQVPGSCGIQGPYNVCINNVVVYSAQWISGATGYTWAVPPFTTILSGQGSGSITLKIDTGYVGGTLSVYASNCVGNGRTAAVTLTHSNCGPYGLVDPETAVDNISDAPALDAIAYPNPFTGQFHLRITSSSGNEAVQVRIFNIAGQLMEESDKLTATEEITVGERLQSGMYLVQVSQGINVKVLRIIKTE